jgi:hypothetical protein|tara:strand:- start:15 stop:257 length:243 start_codon:yes stop_codon:yes gene_type:complete
MKINIYPEIDGDNYSDEHLVQLYTTLSVLYDEFNTVPEQDSKILADDGVEVIEFSMIQKKYQIIDKQLNIIMLYKNFDSL